MYSCLSSQLVSLLWVIFRPGQMNSCLDPDPGPVWSFRSIKEIKGVWGCPSSILKNTIRLQFIHLYSTQVPSEISFSMGLCSKVCVRPFRAVLFKNTNNPPKKTKNNTHHKAQCHRAGWLPTEITLVQKKKSNYHPELEGSVEAISG